jgi:hypothetical protein
VGFDFFRDDDRLVHGDGPPVYDSCFLQVNPSLYFWQIPSCQYQVVTTSGEI